MGKEDEEEKVSEGGHPIAGEHRDWKWRGEPQPDGTWNVYVQGPEQTLYTLATSVPSAGDLEVNAKQAIDDAIESGEPPPEQETELPAEVQEDDRIIDYEHEELVQIDCTKIDCERIWVRYPYEALTFTADGGSATVVEQATVGAPDTADGRLYVRWRLDAMQEPFHLVATNLNTQEKYRVRVSTPSSVQFGT